MDLIEPAEHIEPPFELPEGLDAGVRWSESDNGFWISLPHARLFYSATFFDRISSDSDTTAESGA